MRDWLTCDCDVRLVSCDVRRLETLVLKERSGYRSATCQTVACIGPWWSFDELAAVRVMMVRLGWVGYS